MKIIAFPKHFKWNLIKSEKMTNILNYQATLLTLNQCLSFSMNRQDAKLSFILLIQGLEKSLQLDSIRI